MDLWKIWMKLAIVLMAVTMGTAACGGDGGDDDDDDTTDDDDDTADDDDDDDTADDDDDDDTADDDDDDDTADDDDDTERECPMGTTPLTGNADVCVLSGDLIEDLTLTPDFQWLLRGGVFVGTEGAGAVSVALTIEPGTTIYGDTNSNSMLVIRRGSKIMADGTAEAPIVFTSAKAPGSRARGDWGGLIVNGSASVNGCPAEADPCEAFGEGGTGFFGGNDDADDSGVLRYVRVEFAGRLISPDNELNGIALQGVGSATTVDYVQVHCNADDGIEMFGGTVNLKHVLVTCIGDDQFDWTDGWRGKAQYLIAQQYPDATDNGIEADNNAENNDSAPRSSPVISNVTLIGAPESDKSDLGLLLREGTGARLHNVLVMGFNEACLDVDNPATFANALNPDNSLTGNLMLAHSILSCAVNFKADEDNVLALDQFYAINEGNRTVPFGDPILADPYNLTAPDFRPAAGSPARTGGMAPADSFFDDVDFIGAIDPEDDWTAGWTTADPN